MRDIRRRVERKQQRLKRAADGRLLPAADDSDIGDIWAEQKRIRLREAIIEDQRRTERRERRKQMLRRVTGRLRRAPAAGATIQDRAQAGRAREIEIRLNLPAVKLPKAKAVRRTLTRIPKPKVQKKYALVAGSLVAAAALGLGGWQLFGQRDGQGAGTAAGKGVSRSTLGAAAGEEMPDYPTVLPEGKTIEALGGWGRVSPPDRDPVFAYADAIGGVKITVSQQPLPDDFKSNVSEEIAALAKQFQANEKLAVSDGVAYLGTSVRGPQSVVASKEGLLILIKSTATVPEGQWAAYLQALKAN